MLREIKTKALLLRQPFGLSRSKALVFISLKIFIFGVLLGGCSHFSGKNGEGGAYNFGYSKLCVYTKVAFDVGSGSTKMQVARVDVCKGKILKIFLQQQVAVAYKENLVKLGSGFRFNKLIQQKGFLVLKRLKKQAEVFKPHKFVGVGTSAFRKASNAKVFLERIKKQLNIKIKILTHKQEAKMGFASAQVLVRALDKKIFNKNKKLVVWDIGGGSMQMLFQEDRKASNFFLKKQLIYKGNLASVSFKQYIIKKIQKKKDKKTPNPLGSKVSKKAEKYAFNYAKKTVELKLKKLFNSSPIVLGIGGVHYHSVFKQIKKSFKAKNFYTKYQLQKTLNRRKHLSDQQIGGRYASTDISNLVLVLSFMKLLNINKIYTGKVNLTNGVLLNL